MAKQRSLATDYLVYLVIRLFVAVIQAVSLESACTFASFLAWVVYHVDRRHRLVALDNLRHAFGDQYTPAQRDRLVRAVYRHFCCLLMEIIHLPRKLHTSNWRSYIEFPDAPVVVDALLSGRPLLFVTGHFGNWEVGGYVLGLFGFKTHAVARPLDNPYLDQFLRSFRERTGQKLLAKKGDFDQMQQILAKGGVIATLGDQDAGQRGLFVDFFGRPASSHKAIALLALQFEVPILVMGARNRGRPMLYEMRVEDRLEPEAYADQPDAVRALTQHFTHALERLVRLAPKQYFWLHRRWKHEPPRSKRRAA